MQKTDSTQPPGLYRKFEVHRTDGRDQPGGDRHGAQYFVLDLTYCPYARRAASVYADNIAGQYPQVADEMRAMLAALPPAPAPDGPPLPYMSRVLAEKVELDERIAKLAVFFQTPTFAGVNPDEQRRMQAQHAAMSYYSKILGERISAFTSKA